MKNGKMTISQQNDLKTLLSYRTLPLDDNFYNYLTELKIKQEENKILFGDSYMGEFDDYICINAEGDLLKPDYVSDMFGKILKKNKLKHIRYHDLRHPYVKLATQNFLNIFYNVKNYPKSAFC